MEEIHLLSIVNMHQGEKYSRGARGFFCYWKVLFKKRQTSKCFKFPDPNKGICIKTPENQFTVSVSYIYGWAYWAAWTADTDYINVHFKGIKTFWWSRKKLFIIQEENFFLVKQKCSKGRKLCLTNKFWLIMKTNSDFKSLISFLFFQNWKLFGNLENKVWFQKEFSFFF